MTTQLTLYNGALLALKERKLASLSENNESRRALDIAWDGAVKYCLEAGLWNFAMRTAKFTRDTAFTASFGYKNKFVKPSDFVRLGALCYDEYFNTPLNAYTDEAGAWYADEDIIYVSYVSDDANYGNSLNRWPESFVNFVTLYLADQAGGRITGKEDLVKEALGRAEKEARAKDAMNEPTKFMPQGNWTKARGGGRSQRDRGNRGSLIG